MIKYAAERVTVNAGQLAAWQGSASADVLILAGPCPTCGASSSHTIARQISALESMAAKPVAALTADLKCACEETHPGRPDTESAGCGRSWYVSTTVAANGTITLASLPAVPGPALALARKTLDDAGPQQLIDLRGAAEKWIGGVTALFGLFGLVGVIFTRSTMAGLGTWWQVGVGIAATMSVGIAGRAVYWIYRAAYGWPVTRLVSTDDEVLAWYQGRQAAPRLQASYMRNGVRAAAWALAVLVVAVGLLWFAPQQPAAAPLVQATLHNGSRVCGTLLPASASGAPQIRRASDGTAVSVPLRSIVSLTAAGTC